MIIWFLFWRVSTQKIMADVHTHVGISDGYEEYEEISRKDILRITFLFIKFSWERWNDVVFYF